MDDRNEMVSFDLDSTLCDTTHRQKLIVDGFNDWEHYSLQCADDGPGPALPIAQYLSSIGAPFVICSARNEAARELTRTWLQKHGVFPWAIVLDKGDHTGHNHSEWKAEQLLTLQEKFNRKIVCHFDDWTGVAEATEKIGIPTILVHKANGLGEFLA